MSQNCSKCGKELNQRELSDNPKKYVNKTEKGVITSTAWVCSDCHQDQIEHKGSVEQ